MVTMLNGEKEISTDLDNIKLFFKMHILMLLFHFFTEGLPKYDMDDADLPNQYDGDAENLPKLSFKFYFNNSLICLDDLKDTIACNLDMYMIYERLNIKSIKEELLNQRLSENNTYENSMQWYELRVNVVQCNPYFCRYEDLDGTKDFKQINKRELIKPFALCYSTKNKVERFASELFRINTNTDINVEKVSVKISINQVVSFLSMINNTAEILNEKYTLKIQNDEETPNPKNVNDSLTKKSIAEVTKHSDQAQNIKNTFEVFSNRISQVPKQKVKSMDSTDEFDEYEGTVSKQDNIAKLKNPIKMRQKTDIEESKRSTGDFVENRGTNVFQFFFHGLSVFFINDYKDNFYPVLCVSLKETNYNKENRIDGSFVSQAHIDAEFDYYNIKNGYWEPFIEGMDIEFEYDKQQENKVIQIKGNESINLNISPDFVSVLNYCLKSWEEARKNLKDVGSLSSIYDPLNMFAEDVKTIYNNEEIKTQERNTMFTLNDEKNVIDVATPYKVRNLTGLTIFIETLFDDNKEKYILNDSQTTKIAISYEKQTRKNFDGISSKMNDNVKIQFQGLYLPIQKISLNKIGKAVHKLTENEDENKEIFYETKVIDMNKVLTLRTKNILINSTQFSYDVIIKNPTERGEDKKYMIQPNE